MAQVRLHPDHAAGDMPSVCMCCGKRAKFVETYELICYPWWNWFFFALTIFASYTVYYYHTAMVQMPLCRDHQGYYTWRNRLPLFVVGAIAAYVSIGLLVYLVLLPPAWQDRIGLVLFALGILFVLALLLLLQVMKYTGIRLKSVASSEIVIAGVCEAFVDAVEAQQAAEEEDEDDEPPPPPKKRRLAKTKINAKPPRRKPARDEE